MKCYCRSLYTTYFCTGTTLLLLSSILCLCSPHPHPCSGYRCPACPQDTDHTALPEASPHTPPPGGRGWARRRGGARCPPYLKTEGINPSTFSRRGECPSATAVTLTTGFTLHHGVLQELDLLYLQNTIGRKTTHFTLCF